MKKVKLKRSVIMLLMIALFSFCPVLTLHSLAQKSEKVTLNLKDAKIEQVFSQIQKQTGYNFVISSELAKSLPKVSVQTKDKPIRDLLKQVLDFAGCTYDISGRTITVYRKISENRDRTITGYVRDESGEPLIGVPICIGESRVCTVTDEKGYYVLKIPTESCYLKFSYVGMKTLMELVPSGRNTIQRDVVLTNDTQLDDVVVTGIFRKARESYTGSVSSIDKEQLEQFRGQNMLQTLKNVDASINFSIDNLNGSNPNNLPNINIRGSSSLPMSVEEFNAGEANNPNTPLIIMDGFEISLQKLMDYNDEEIESINILKDAAATAIYGSRGANGVIVVVSKQPEPGKLKVNLEAGIQMEIPDLSSYHLLNAAEKLELERKAGLYDFTPRLNNDYGLSFQESYNNRLRDVLNGVNTDWLAKPLRTGVGQKYNLRVEGGSTEFRWAAQAQYNDIEGAMKGSTRRTFNGSITLLYKLKNLTFRNYTSVGINRAKESPYGAFSNYVTMQPYNTPYDADGNLVMFFPQFRAGEVQIENPLYNASLGSFNKNGYQELTNNFSVDWNILPELTLRGQLGISTTDTSTDVFRSPQDTYYTNTTTGTQYQTGDGFFRRGMYRYGDGKRTSYNADLTLSYNKVFNDVHSFYAGLNWSLLSINADYLYLTMEGFSSDDLAKVPNARGYSQTELPSGYNTKQMQLGVTGNINYTYNSKYYIDFSYRVDGNSSYGSEKKFAPFWSAGIGWNLHNEKFLKGNKVINMFRLKASYGETGAASGASETDAYTYYRYVTNNRYMSWTGAMLGGFGNPNLSWQTTSEFNVGTEFGLWDNRVKGSFEVYTKKTDNLLSSMDMPLATGFPAFTANIGEVKNKGWEAALQTFIIRDNKRQINWMVGAQLVYNKNKITKLSQAIKDQTAAFMKQGVDDNSSSGIQSLFFEGDPQNSIYAVRSLGIDPSTGKEIFLDKNGNKTDLWNASAKVFCGSADPLYRGNLNTMFQWGNFTLNASLGYYWGGKRYNSTLRDRVEVTLSTIMSSNVDERVLSSRWYQAGDVTFFKALSDDVTKASSRYVMDDNVLELQSVSLQYKLKNNWLLKNFNLNTMIFSINMNDLFHWGSIRMERGTSYPYARNIQASVKLMF